MTCAMCRELRRGGAGMVARRKRGRQVADFADTKAVYVAIEVGWPFKGSRSSLASHASERGNGLACEYRTHMRATRMIGGHLISQGTNHSARDGERR